MAEARKALQQRQLELSQGHLVTDPKKTLVGEQLQHWLEHIAKPSVSYHTHESYEISVRRRLIPALGHIRLIELRPQHIQELYTELGKAHAPKTIRQTHVALNQALKIAVEWDMIPNNPAERVKLPKIQTAEKLIPSPEQVAHFLGSVRGHRLYALWHLFAMTGMRKGEVLGLKWTDMDWDKGRLSIRRQIVRKTGVGLVLDDTKTFTSKRTIDLDAGTMRVLLEHKDRQRFEREKTDPSTTWAVSQQLLKAAGLPRMKLHAFRDALATAMISAGIDARIVSEHLGHRDVATTLRTYYAAQPVNRKAAVERLAELYATAGNGS
jgi:integrase